MITQFCSIQISIFLKMMSEYSCHADVRKHLLEIPRQARNDNAFNCHADVRKHLRDSSTGSEWHKSTL